MQLNQLPTRIRNVFGRRLCRLFGRRVVRLTLPGPTISFTFDDFPRSALCAGGDILRQKGFVATYYASLGLMGQFTPTGEIFTRSDLPRLFEQGHELGCHTCDHCDACLTSPTVFEQSVLKNKRLLHELAPGRAFETLSYPISFPRVRTKLRIGRLFLGCRGGGQTYNQNMADLNYLKAFFLEQCSENLELVRDLIQRNRAAKGWLILATHDVAPSPTPYGCTPQFLKSVVECVAESGANVMTVAQVCRHLTVHRFEPTSSPGRVV